MAAEIPNTISSISAAFNIVAALASQHSSRAAANIKKAFFLIWTRRKTEFNLKRLGSYARNQREITLTASKRFADDAFRLQLAGMSLTTAEILYRLPDYPTVLQSYIWQEYDLAPRFPKLREFLDFWVAKLEGPLFKVTVAHARLIRPAELRLVAAEYKLH